MNKLFRSFRRWLRKFLEGPPRKRKIQTGKYAGIAKILVGNGPDHAGMGIVVDPFHVITCAHVINAALGRDENAEGRPDNTINVVFPMSRDQSPIQAVTENWRPPGLMPKDDIAVLRLASEAPEEAGIATLADVTRASPDGDELSIFGLARGDFLGNHVAARFKGPTTSAWIQLDGVDSAFIEEGYSGAAVWDQPYSAVLGMVVAKRPAGQQHVAYMIPAAELNNFKRTTPIEYRSLSASFAVTWTLFSAAYFVALLAHWAWGRGMQAFSAITLAPNHQELAAFWGMHIYALFAPVPLLMLISFARSFRLHDWVTRVPSFGSLRLRPVSCSTWRTAAASLAAFVILPLAAQIHFLDQFHSKGSVYVYPDSFGYTSDDPVFYGQRCCKRSIHLCTTNEAGRYSLATAKPGTVAGYRDNAYHYGECDGGDGSTVTFFPILQPVLLMLLTAFSAVLTAVALFLVFRMKPGQLLRSAQK